MIGKDLSLAIDLLNDGKLVSIPTETVYGLAANALNEQAVIGIFKAKNRPFFDPLIVHVANVEQAKKYSNNWTLNADKLSKQFWPGPMTLLLEKNNLIPDIITSGSSKVALRIPKHPLTLELLSQLNFPLAAPSANPFGYISPTKPSHVEKQLSNQVNYIIDGGDCEVGIESTIVDCTSDKAKVLRLGGLSINELALCLGYLPELNTIENSNPQAPGQLDKHYAPHSKLIIVEDLNLINLKDSNTGVLSFGKHFKSIPNVSELNLSEVGNLDEAAKNLFSYLRILDEMKLNQIYTQYLPNIGLGIAINDRLKRASQK